MATTTTGKQNTTKVLILEDELRLITFFIVYACVPMYLLTIGLEWPCEFC